MYTITYRNWLEDHHWEIHGYNNSSPDKLIKIYTTNDFITDDDKLKEQLRLKELEDSDEA